MWLDEVMRGLECKVEWQRESELWLGVKALRGEREGGLGEG